MDGQLGDLNRKKYTAYALYALSLEERSWRVQLALGPLVDAAYDLGPPVDELALHRSPAHRDLVRIQRRALRIGGCVLHASDGRDARRSGTSEVVLRQEGVGGSGLGSAKAAHQL